MKRLALIGASLVLVGGMASACGSPPEDADKDEFCEAYQAIFTASDDDEAQDKLDDLEDIGTPEEIDGDAREGFEIIIDKGIDADEDDIDDDEMEKAGKFMTAASELCGGATDTDTGDMEDELDDLETDGLETE